MAAGIPQSVIRPKGTAIGYQYPGNTPHHQIQLPNVNVPQPDQGTSGTGKPGETSQKKKGKKFVRVAGGTVWEDPSLSEWDPNDFRIFCGDLGNDVNDDVLAKAFSKYPSFLKAKVVRDKRSNKSRGFGFVSFKVCNIPQRRFIHMCILY